MSFKNKVVIVTGGSSGIGSSTAIKFASEGAHVVIVGRNVSKLKRVEQQCAEAGGKLLTIVADVTKDDDLKRIVSETISRFDKLDVLINNAGKGGKASILDADYMKFFDDVLRTNLRSAAYLTNLAAPHLVQTKGNIINISSVAAIGTFTSEFSFYNTSKAALDHFSRSVALDLAEKGVRVNTVNPGPVKTDFFENMGYEKGNEEYLLKSMANLMPLKRVSEAEEIADLVLFLASDKAKSVTGSSYVCDNGALLAGSAENLFNNK